MRMLSVRVRYGAQASFSSFDCFGSQNLKGMAKLEYGLACTKAGEVPLQGTCGEFDSLRVHVFGFFRSKVS